MKYPIMTNLDHVIAQLVTFATGDYLSMRESVPEDVALNIAYAVSCFIAQHTVNGHYGVTTDTALDGMQVTTDHPYEYRLVLAQRLIADHGGIKQ